MRTLKLTLAYDGTNYVGWQRQANGLSVQQVRRGGVRAADRRRRPPTVAGASRTDAGVHALGQVASVNVDDRSRAVGRPARAERPAARRHPRASAWTTPRPAFTRGFTPRQVVPLPHRRRRRCCRRSIAGYVWHAPEPRDIERDARAPRRCWSAARLRVVPGARLVDARHGAHHRTRWTSASARGEIVIEVDGDGFLRHMVRAIVGTLADVGAGLRPPDVDGATIARRRAIAAPAGPTRAGARADAGRGRVLSTLSAGLALSLLKSDGHC